MQKDNFFTQTLFVPKNFYPKKCINYDKSSLRQNSIKGLKDPNSEKEKMPKSNIKFQNGQKKMPQKAQNCAITHFPNKTV